MSVSKKRNPWMIFAIVAAVVLLLAGAVFLCLVYLNEYSLVLTLHADEEMTLEYGSDFEDPGAECVYFGTIFQQEPLTVAVVVDNPLDLSKIGTYEIRYYAEYEVLSASKIRVVHVVDTVDPELTLAGEEQIILSVGEEYQEPGCTATDNYNGNLTDAVEVSGELDPAVPGSYILTYSVSDESGNTVQVCRTVTYVDVTAPVITLTGDAEVIIDTGSEYTDPGCTAADDCDGDVTDLVAVSGTVDTDIPGTYVLVYTVTDAGGNTATARRVVTVKDTSPPELELLGALEVRLTIGNSFADPGYTAVDDADGDLTEQVVVTNNINMYLPGTYTVTYSVTDAAGNTSQKSRTVVMVDITAKTSGGIIYLTYDDGPSWNTAQLLDVLDKYGVKATFFVVNSGYGETMARAAASGHTIGIHSASHRYEQIYSSEEAFFNDLYRMQSIIQSYTGQTTMIMRFPGGSSNTTSSFNPGIMTRLTRLVQDQGFRYFDWNVDSRDAGGIESYADMSYNVIRGISTRSTSVVLMHDSYGYCIRATERIIQWGLANGYTFAALTYDGPGCHHGVQN